MVLRIIDTDHVSLLERNQPLVVQRSRMFLPEEIAITVVTFEEQMRGRLNTIRRANSDDKVIAAYSRLQATAEFLKRFNLIDFDGDACSCFNDFRRQKIRIGTQDLRIASIAFSRNAIVVTRNTRDFSKVPGLILEDWTVV
ncbi:MAG: type II toxin-antitoxin system VapC family toxin [Cyanobacteriota bacterium]|nr:type II toxin-antitoxin system VapC family toxin [Cyanobacteriota bacterium]